MVGLTNLNEILYIGTILYITHSLNDLFKCVFTNPQSVRFDDILTLFIVSNFILINAKWQDFTFVPN